VTDPRDNAVTAYVRMKIREWEQSGRDQVELAKRVDVAPSTISQVKTRTGVGSRSIDGFARAFGFKTVKELQDAAYLWFMAQGETTASLAAESGVAEAIEMVLPLRPGVTRAQVETILHAFTHERFRGRDASFWVKALLEELQLERRMETAAIDAKKTAERDTRAHRAKVHGEMRTGHRRRKEASVPPPAAPPTATPTEKKTGRG
jgi:hypothetical protein